jgi:hypothetical protein
MTHLAAVLLTFLCWQSEQQWQSSFAVNKSRLSATGENRYFVLKPGRTLWFEKGKDSIVSAVLNETRIIDGVETRVVEDRETKNGQLVEVTRDYYALDSRTGDVYYFGEDVDEYQNGKVTGHGGSWLSGVKGAKFGLTMPGVVKLGQRFYQEQAPGVGMDRAEIVAVGETVTTPAGTFTGCVRTRESSPLEKGTEEKVYAPGIGVVKDGGMPLVKIELRVLPG